MTLVWFRRAVHDLEALRAYIAQENPTAAEHLDVRIESAVSLLVDQPSMGRPGRIPSTRELVVSGTPYIIPYRVRGQTIEIVRVFHTARKWPSRLQPWFSSPPLEWIRELFPQGNSAHPSILPCLWQDNPAEIYNWFTEGFDTKDLQEAKALLDKLA
jgi:toxin ParE1/3/4